ncbi:MAG: B12-binding domain-containing radical SAM protein [Spirochaetes bacterium]|nr:B12-binding domain-containing radical SAM protein [Spirochaetota bacterium]
MPPGNLRSVFIYSSAPGAEASPPLGAGCVAASLLKMGLAAKDEILLLDAGKARSDDTVLEALTAFKPDLVGFSLYLWNSRRLLRIASRLRKIQPGLLIIAGGPDAEGLAYAAQPPLYFDAIFLGEAERSFPAWLDSTLLGGGKGQDSSIPAVLRGPVSDAVDLPSPWIEGIIRPVAGGTVAWELARGCPYRCAYCYEGRGLAGIRPLPLKRVEAELEILKKAKAAEVFVLDPTFNAESGKSLSILALLAERGGEIHWNFEIRAELVDRAQAKAFARLSCSLQIGLQSADPKVLATIGRSLDRKQFASKVRILDEANLIYGFDLIYGLPGDTLGGFKESLDFALFLAPNHLDIFPLAVLPGTTLFEKRKELLLDCQTDPPYLLRSNPGFSKTDMAAAKALSASTGLFYSKGRAVPWFRAVVKPLGMSPSTFLGELDLLGVETEPNHRRIEAIQCAHIERMYRAWDIEKLLPAALDLVRYYGAWSRAFAEGEQSCFELSYPLDLVESPLMLDLKAVVRGSRPKPRLIEIRPGRGGPRARQLTRQP